MDELDKVPECHHCAYGRYAKNASNQIVHESMIEGVVGQIPGREYDQDLSPDLEYYFNNTLIEVWGLPEIISG